MKGEALIIPIRLAATPGALVRENLRVHGAAIRVRLGGAGIRSIEFDERTNAFWLISGADLNDENRDFRIAAWNGDPQSAPQEFATFPRHLKPEGIARATIDGRPVSVIVFDTGRFSVLH